MLQIEIHHPPGDFVDFEKEQGFHRDLLYLGIMVIVFNS